MTSSYSSLDWEQLTKSWQILMYSTYPNSKMPVDKPSLTRSSKEWMNTKSFGEVMEEVLEDRSEAWDKLADL